MHYKAALLLLIAAFMIWQPNLSTRATDAATTEVTLYAHTDPSATSFDGRVLSLSGNATRRQSADARGGLDFTLVPPLSSQLRVLWVDMYVWLVSQEAVRGTLRASMSEVTTNASVLEIISGSLGTTTAIPTTPYQVQFGLGPLNYTVKAGSSVRFSAEFSPARPVPVMLLWDDQFTQTRVNIEVEAFPTIDLRVTDTHGRSSAVFAENDTRPVMLIADVSIEDPFRGVNIRNVTLTVTNSTGGYLIRESPMNLTSRAELPFRLDYVLRLTVPAGYFNITATVNDVAGRTFPKTRGVIVTRFHSIILILVDAHKRPLPNLTVSISTGDQLIHRGITNSNGTMVSLLPPSQIVGPLSLQVVKSDLLVLTHEIHVEADATLQLEVPLHDWRLFVIVQGLNTPVSGATVDLYFNGTAVGSARSDVNGLAYFRDLPLGAYEIAVSSSIGSRRFSNMTHSASGDTPHETVLELSVIPGVPDTALLVLIAIAVMTFIGAIAGSRRRGRTRHFSHVAELFGGTIPKSAIMMIVGPTGSGKSLLLHNLLVDSFGSGRRCVYVTNSELPARVRSQLTRLGVNTQKGEAGNKLRFIDAYSGTTGTPSSEKHSVPSARNLTALGMQLTSCFDEIGGAGDVFFDAIGPSMTAGSPEHVFDFVRYYGARTTKEGGTVVFTASTAIEPELLSRLEEAADCVLKIETVAGLKGMRGRLLIKKARGVEHEREWVGFKIASNGRMEFVSLPSEKR